MEDEPVISKKENLFDLLGSESEKTEPKDLFGGFVNATNTNNDDFFNPFVSKTNTNVCYKIILSIVCNNYSFFFFLIHVGW